MTHPGRILDPVEELGYVVIKIFEIGEILTLTLITTVVVGHLTVSKRDDLVENPHDDIVVVAILSIFESDVGVVEEVV